MTTSPNFDTTTETDINPRRGRVHYIHHHNEDGTRSYWCGKVSTSRAMSGPDPDLPRCHQCAAAWELAKDFQQGMSHTTIVALNVLNMLDGNHHTQR